eukprot:jgi/Tetstr1/456762/TSEL_043459.t1
MVEDFNRNMMMMLMMGVWITIDEAMSAYRPRSNKTNGLPNISFIKRKPKPLGTEGNVTCRHFIGCVKTFHFLYPKAYLESHLKDKPAGSRMAVLRSTVEDVVSQYFDRIPRVDNNHNQSRQHDMLLEELWMTQDCWFRPHTTIACIYVTNL